MKKKEGYEISLRISLVWDILINVAGFGRVKEKERDTIFAVLKGSHSDGILDRAWPSIALQGGMLQQRRGGGKGTGEKENG